MKTILRQYSNTVTCGNCETVFSHSGEDLEFKYLVEEEKYNTKNYFTCVKCPLCESYNKLPACMVPKFWVKKAKEKAYEDDGYRPEDDDDLGIKNGVRENTN